MEKRNVEWRIERPHWVGMEYHLKNYCYIVLSLDKNLMTVCKKVCVNLQKDVLRSDMLSDFVALCLLFMLTLTSISISDSTTAQIYDHLASSPMLLEGFTKIPD